VLLDAPEAYPNLVGTAGFDLDLFSERLHLNARVRYVGERGATASNVFYNLDTPLLAAPLRTVDLTLTTAELYLLGDTAETRIVLSAADLLNRTRSEPAFGGYDLPSPAAGSSSRSASRSSRREPASEPTTSHCLSRRSRTMKTSILLLAIAPPRLHHSRAGRPADPSSPDAIRIAALTDRTGTSATLSYSGRHRAGLQADERGPAFELPEHHRVRPAAEEDTASKTDQAVRQAREAVAAGARALITEISADTIARQRPQLLGEHGPAGQLLRLLLRVHQRPQRPRTPIPCSRWRSGTSATTCHRLFMNSKYEAAVQMRVAMSHGWAATPTATATSRWR
jgi:hypothetical protein